MLWLLEFSLVSTTSLLCSRSLSFLFSFLILLGDGDLESLLFGVLGRLFGDLDRLLGDLDLLFGDLDLLRRDLDLRLGDLDLLLGDLDRRRGDLDLFLGDLDLFLGDLDLFRGDLDLFRGDRDLFRGDRDLFFGVLDLLLGVLDLFLDKLLLFFPYFSRLKLRDLLGEVVEFFSFFFPFSPSPSLFSSFTLLSPSGFFSLDGEGLFEPCPSFDRERFA